MAELLKPGDPCPCCGKRILTSDPDKLLMLIWIGQLLDPDTKSRPEPGAAAQS